MPFILSVNGVYKSYKTDDEFGHPSEEFQKLLEAQAKSRDFSSKSHSGSKKLKTYVSNEERQTRKRAAQVQDLMSTDVITLSESDTIEAAFQILNRSSVRHIPILKSANPEITGMLSDRDLLRCHQEDRSAPVSKIMSKKVLSTTSKTAVGEAAGVMIKNKINALPVLDEKHQVIGILTSSDLLRAIWNHGPVDLWV